MRRESVILLALLYGGTAGAQTVDYGALEQVFGEPVTTSATGEPQRASETPVDMEIVTQEDIRRSGAVDIPGALRFVPGIDERAYGAMRSDIGLRGYNQPSNPRLLVLLNGRQVYLDDYGEVDWNSIPVQLGEIRQIEVVKGPNSALYGFNAAYGVINIVTYDPLADDIGRVTAFGGTGGQVGGSVFKTIPLGESVGVRLSLGGRQADPYAGTRRFMFGNPVGEPQAANAALSGKAQLSPGTQLSLDLSTTNSEGPYNEGYNYSNVFIRTNSQRIALSSDTDLGLMTFDAYRNDERYSTQPNYGDYRDQVYVLQASDDIIVSPASNLRLHAEYRSDQLAFMPGGETSYDIYAGSAIWNWQVSERLSWASSARIDYLTLHHDGPLAPLSGLTPADYANRSIADFSFNSGLVYRASDADTIKLTFGRGLQMPSLYDLGIQQVFPHDAYALVGNPHLKPTVVKNVGLDYERDLPDLSSKLDIDLFAQRSDDLYVEPSSTPHVPVGRGNYWYYFAAETGYGMAAGAEIALKGGTKAGLHWNASYSFVTTSDHSGVNYQSRESYVDFGRSTPRHVVIVGLGDSWGPVEADIQARWQSAYRDFVAPTENYLRRYDIDPYATVTLRLGYRLTDSASLSFTAEQLNADSIRTVAGPEVERRFTFQATAGF